MNLRNEQDATTELLHALDELYPLPDDAKQTERAGRTAFVVKRWMSRAIDEIAASIPRLLREVGSPPDKSVTSTPLPDDAVANPRCLDCGKPYLDFPMDVILPRPQWLNIHPDENGLLCAACIVARCAKVPRATCCHLIIEIAPPAAEAPVLLPPQMPCPHCGLFGNHLDSCEYEKFKKAALEGERW